MADLIDNIGKHISGAVSHYWQTRKAQREKQKKRGLEHSFEEKSRVNRI